MTVILCEQIYLESIWCRQLLSGLEGELKKRRTPYTLRFDPEGIVPSDTVFIVGSNFSWLSAAIAACNRLRLAPVVLCNQSSHSLPGKYHCICSDLSGSMQQMILWLQEKGKKRIALYGVNPESVSDLSREKTFLSLVGEGSGIYPNDGSLENCFQRFLPHAAEYDAVICTNGFAAISLVKHLTASAPELLSVLSVLSCSQVLLSDYYAQHITSVHMDFPSFGRAAIAAAELTARNETISYLTITIRWKLDGREIPPFFAPGKCSDIVDDNFYADRELQQMMRIENLLNICTETDLQILEHLLRDEVYEKIAEACFLSERSVKYHVRKYMELCLANSRTELTALLKEYLNTNAQNP